MGLLRPTWTSLRLTLLCDQIMLKAKPSAAQGLKSSAAQGLKVELIESLNIFATLLPSMLAYSYAGLFE